MLRTRVIPCLLLKEGGLTKTVKFGSQKYVGDPINAVKIFNEKEVDELIFIDIDASKNNTPPNFNLIESIATESFMPFSYGGGIKTIDHITTVLRLGVEKAIINSQAINNINFIEQAASHFGSSTIIGAIDVKKDFWGNYKVFDHSRNKLTSIDPVLHAKNLVTAGVGEIFLNNVDRDGTYKGLDRDIVILINQAVNIPLIVCGGISSIKEVKDIIASTKVSGIAAGSLFVFQGPHRAVLISYPSYDELEQ